MKDCPGIKKAALLSMAPRSKPVDRRYEIADLSSPPKRVCLNQNGQPHRESKLPVPGSVQAEAEQLLSKEAEEKIPIPGRFLKACPSPRL